MLLSRRGARERARERREIVGGRPAPAVDGLLRVTDGHDGGVVEDRGEQVGLDDGGVLVLVQEDHSELVAKIGRDIRGGLHDPKRASHLIGEVQRVVGALALRVVRDEPREDRQSAHAPSRRVDQALVLLEPAGDTG